MSCYIVDRMGGGDKEDDDPTPDRMRQHLASLDPHDTEHSSVRLVHRESKWGLEYFGGLLVLENTKIPNSEAHLRNVDTEKALELWQLLAVVNVDAVRALPWKSGYG